MGWIDALILSGLGIVWLYCAARVVTHAVLLTHNEFKKEK